MKHGDKTKQPPECKIDDTLKCPNIKCTYEGWEGESYRCDVCGESYKLYYEDMA